MNTVNAQKFEEIKSTNTVNETIQLPVGDTVYTVEVSINGAYKMDRISKKSGNTYKYYLGYNTGEKFNGELVFTNHSSKNAKKYWYLVPGEGKYPKKVYLKMSTNVK